MGGHRRIIQRSMPDNPIRFVYRSTDSLNFQRNE